MTITTTTSTVAGYVGRHAAPEGAHRVTGAVDSLRLRRDQAKAARVITRATKDAAKAAEAIEKASAKVNKAAASTANAKTVASVVAQQVPAQVRVKELAGHAAAAQAEAVVAKAETKEAVKAVAKSAGEKVTKARRGTGAVLGTAATAVNETVKVDWFTTLFETETQRSARRQRALLGLALQGAAFLLKR